MSFLAKITDVLGGSIFKEIKEGVMAYFPPDMNPLQKAEMELKVTQLLNDKQIQANKVIEDAAKQLDKRISEQEGTAADLKTIPIIGHIVIFLRGVQRPLWGYATLWMDFKWFFETHTFSEQQQTAMIVINVLVLGFLFGERTIKNLEPLIMKVFAK